MSNFPAPQAHGGATVKKNDTPVGTRQGINLIEGANITLTVADDGTNGEVDVTIASAAGGLSISEEGGAATAVTSLDFVGSMTTASAVGAAGTVTTAHGAQAGGTTHDVAVAGGAAGFMSGADKTKLDGIATGATAGVTTQEEGVQQGTGQTTLDFVGAGVTAAAVGAKTTVTIPGAGVGYEQAGEYRLVDGFKTTTAAGSLEHWVTATANGGTVGPATTALDATHVAPATLTISTSASSRAAITYNANAEIALGATAGGWEFICWFQVSALSDATDTYELFFGLGDSSTISGMLDSVSIRYTHGTNSGRLVGVTESATTETAVNGGAGAALTANAWWGVKWTINAAGNSVEFFYDSGSGWTSMGTSTTNIPTGTSRATGRCIGITRTAGTSNARVLYLDYVSLIGDLR